MSEVRAFANMYQISITSVKRYMQETVRPSPMVEIIRNLMKSLR